MAGGLILAHYLVKFKVTNKSEYRYPSGVKECKWKSVAYHGTKQLMIGETDKELRVDGKSVIALDAERASRLLAEFRSSYPRRKRSRRDSETRVRKKRNPGPK